MQTSRLIAFALAAALPLAASAHKVFMVPSQTVFSGGGDNWVTVDAAISNDLFYFNHHALGLDNLTITGPGGTRVDAENRHTGKWRSTFDVHLPKDGSYRLSIATGGVSASYELGGERKFWRGAAADLGKLPKDAQKLEVTESIGRVETFVSVGAPDETALAPTGQGLELAAVTHPNDLYSGEKASFKLLIDGKPAPDVAVTVIPAGTRWRNAQDEIKTTAAADGSFSVTWPQAGLYWLNAVAEDAKTSVAGADKRRLSYVATLEVLPQ